MTVATARRAASIAVAPISSPLLEPGEALVATGFLEDLIAELARFPELEVLAARTSLSLTPEQLEPARLAERFGVTHLLDSSLRASGEMLQVKADLLETDGGRQVWTQRFEAPVRRVHALGEELAAHVANLMSAQINMTRLVGAKARPLASLEAYDLWLRGRDCLRRGTIETDLEARDLFERALAIDPTYARAWAGLSLSHFNDWSCQRWTCWEEGERLAFEYACKAEDLDQSDAVVQAVLGRILIYRGNIGQGRRHLERALTLSPNDADILMKCSLWWGIMGEPEQAIAMADKAFRLNPLHDDWYYVYAFFAYFIGRRLEAGLALVEKAAPHGVIDQSAFMAAAYAHLGRADRAREQLAMFLDVFRERITYGREPAPDEPLSFLLHVNPFGREEDAAFLVEGLRKAGLGGQRAGGAYRYRDEAETGRFALRGELWQVEFAGRTAHVRDMKGCRDLALLLAAPRERVHCMDIAGRVAESDSGAAMDGRARAACQMRIRDLQEDLAEAERDGDLARSERLGEELDALIEQLSAAMGLGGRSRKLGDPAEKARTAVTWRIRSAIRKVAEAHAELGRHLEASIRTGAFCVYAPEKPVRWTV